MANWELENCTSPAETFDTFAKIWLMGKIGGMTSGCSAFLSTLFVQPALVKLVRFSMEKRCMNDDSSAPLARTVVMRSELEERKSKKLAPKL